MSPDVGLTTARKVIIFQRKRVKDEGTSQATGVYIPHLDEGGKEERMNRRAFLINGIVATLGLTALPTASALAKLPSTLELEKEVVTPCEATEAEALDDILDYVESWNENLPGHDFRELLFRHLVTEKTEMPYSTFSDHYEKYRDEATAKTTMDA